MTPRLFLVRAPFLSSFSPFVTSTRNKWTVISLFCQVAPTDEPSAPGGVIHLAHAVSGMSLNENWSHIPGDLSPLWMDKLEDASASVNQSVFGSLTFEVGDGKFKAPPAKENTSVGRKAAPRAKVPFEKGYSQMDWLKLTRTHRDLAGLKGSSNRRLVSMDEVRQHQMEGSMWTVLRGRVYNLSPYLKFHPGGVDMLMKAVGKDCTSLFNKYHAWVNAEFLLGKCLVGMLDDSKK